MIKEGDGFYADSCIFQPMVECATKTDFRVNIVEMPNPIVYICCKITFDDRNSETCLQLALSYCKCLI
jgi:hypothetical protein